MDACINIRGYCQKDVNAGDCDCWKAYQGSGKDPSMTFERWKKETLDRYEKEEREWLQRHRLEKRNGRK